MHLLQSAAVIYSTCKTPLNCSFALSASLYPPFPGVLWLSHQTWIPKTCCYKLSSSYQVANLIHKWNSPLYLDSSTSPLSHASPPAGSKSLPSLQHYSSVQFHLILWAKWFFSSFTFLPHINSPVLSTSIKLTGFDAQASATRKIQVITQKSPRKPLSLLWESLKSMTHFTALPRQVSACPLIVCYYIIVTGSQ